MPAIQNVKRRGAVYYWRRKIKFPDGKPVAICLSLRTTVQSVARHFAAAMTAKSEVLMMTLGQTSRPSTLTAPQRVAIFRKALEDMRDELDRNHVQFQREQPDPTYMIEGILNLLEVLLRDLVSHGMPIDAGSRRHIQSRFSSLTEGQREALIEFFADKPDWRERSSAATARELDRVGSPAHGDNVDIARKIAFEGRLAAAIEYRRRMTDPLAMWAGLMDDPRVAPSRGQPSIDDSQIPVNAGLQVPEPWASMTPNQAAAQFIRDNPKITGDAKRQARWTEKTLMQFKASVRLLEKSYGAKPLWRLTREDIVTLNNQFSRLPLNHHKPRRHASMTLEQICREAERELRAKTRNASTIGLGAVTTNRHFLFLRELTKWFRVQVPTMAEIDWKSFVYEDRRDARQQRDAFTEEEGRTIFQLPIWHGCQSLTRRLEPGSEIWHDAGYWVLPIAWYTGCRREEICQLTLNDIGYTDGIWYFAITDENGGRLKNRASKRNVPFAEELIRLGLPGYIEALRAAGETMLFPELRTMSGSRSYGDVFYKQWWTKIAKRLDFVEHGQGMHSFRHMVTTELKFQEVFVETRADLVGHALPGETAGRYSKAARLVRLKEAVDRIPRVTECVPLQPARLLPTRYRAPRPTRARRIAPA